MAGALRTLLGDRSLQLSFRSAALDRARSRYAWDRIAVETQRVYTEVAAYAAGRMGAAR
jgi:glycosyltransferase involved in cell wall biosynthesis